MEKYSHLIEIQFYDHSENEGAIDQEPLICDVFGLLINETPLSYHVMHWLTNQDVNNEESKSYTILKAAVLSIRKYKRK